jgi:hypothetical protein
MSGVALHIPEDLVIIPKVNPRNGSPCRIYTVKQEARYVSFAPDQRGSNACEAQLPVNHDWHGPCTARARQ